MNLTGFDQTLLETQAAFDSIAAAYDAVVAPNVALQAIRDRTRAAVLDGVRPGARLLDLGCGSGLDAVWFGRRGYRVVAVDHSPAMIRETERRVADYGLTAAIDVRQCGIQRLSEAGLGGFDAAYSDLGPLNCVPDLGAAARHIAGVLRADGVFVASVMARLCPWEVALYAARGQFARACLRFADDAVGVPLGDGTVWTRYYTPRRFERPFAAAGFERESLRGVGIFVPPSYCDAFMRRHPRLVSTLLRADDAVGAWPAVRTIGDHFVMALRKANGPAS
jgi:SAM-dependent methyltransferase